MGIYDNITSQIVDRIEAGLVSGVCRMPWHSQNRGRPSNASTGAAYQGINTLNLWIGGMGYNSAKWATFKQWKTLGCNVKRGEKASRIVFWKPIPAKEEGEDGRFVLKQSYVFNADQVDGWKEEPAPVNKIERIAAAERFIAATPVNVRHGGESAFYNRRDDSVQMPDLGRFYEASGYYSVLLHECAHWTGAPSRLDRTFGKRFGDEAYAVEELVAELSAAFLCADLGISSEPRDDHAEYIANWLKVLKSDTKAIFTAATAAQKAADFLGDFSKTEKRSKIIEKIL